MKLKSILNPRIARALIKCGFVVKDIKPFKENRDKSIFLFEETEELKNKLCELKQSN